MPKMNKHTHHICNIKDSKQEVKEETKINFFEELPVEIVHMITNFLNLQDMGRLSRANMKIYQTINSAYCYNFGIYTNVEKTALCNATFKEVSNDMHQQIVARKSADRLFTCREKSLKRQLTLLPTYDSWKHGACLMLSSVLLLGTGIALTVLAMSNYGGEKDFIKAFGITLGGAMVTFVALMGGIASVNSLGDYANDISRELDDHQKNGRKKLYDAIESKIVRLNQ